MTEGKNIISIKKSNLWKYSTFLLLALIIVLLVLNFSGLGITGKAISEKDAGENLVNYFSSIGYDGFEILDVQSFGTMYLISTNYQGEEIPFYVTKDGYIVGNSLVSIIPEKETESDSNQETDTNLQTILECATSSGLEEDTIIFYYSDSCGWCSRMKPGVDSLEQRGYNIYRAEATENDPIIDNCISGHMTSSGVPQFVCVKTGEIKVGAFADSEGNLDQNAMDAWVESCLEG